MTGLFLGYGTYNTMRGAFPLQMRTIAEDLDIPLDRIGAPTSMFSAAYGVAKFFGSVASDYAPCGECHALGLFLSGLAVAALGWCSDLSGFVWLWGLQGLLQAFGWPFLARIVINELPPQTQAKYWGVLCMAGNVGSIVAPYGVVLARQAGTSWRITAQVAGAGACGMALAVWWLLCCGRQRGGSRAQEHTSAQEINGKKAAGSAFATLSAVLGSPVLLALMACNALSYFSSKCTKEWGSLYLQGTRLASSDVQAATLLFWAELGGSCGALLSGFVSSKLGGRHGLTCLLSAILATGALSVMAWSTHKALPLNGSAPGPPLPFALTCALQALSLAGINGVRTLAGFHAAEVAARKGIVGMANGWMEVVGQVGSVMAGQPLGALAAHVADRARVHKSSHAGAHAVLHSSAGWVAVLTVLSAVAAMMAVLNALLIPQEERRLARKSSKGKTE